MQLSVYFGVIAPLVRLILTIGAVLWFPLLQPIAAGVLDTTNNVLHLNMYDLSRSLVLKVRTSSDAAKGKGVSLTVVLKRSLSIGSTRSPILGMPE